MGRLSVKDPLRRFLHVAALLCMCEGNRVYGADDPTLAPPHSMNERVLTISGDPAKRAQLVVTVLMPEGAGPFPLAVMNHGSLGGDYANPESRFRFSFASYYFLSRGYTVALPMMRGFAGSTGRQIADGCNQEVMGIANARDIRSVIEFLSAQPYVDAAHVVVAGESLGGWNSLALGTLHPNIRGLINFAGGANIPNCGDNPTSMNSAAARFGARTALPSLWLYGDNDAVFASHVWRAMFASYRSAGGPAELVAYGRFMSNSHNLLRFPEGLRVWGPPVDAFLAKISMPSAITHPEYLPIDPPPPSGFAVLDDVDAVPYLNEDGREGYRKFLEGPPPRVFVINLSGSWMSVSGGFDPLGRALETCCKQGDKCRVYAVDDYVTWTRPSLAPPATQFAGIQNADAIPYINAAGRKGYSKYLTLPRPKAFVIAPDGAFSIASLGEDPLATALDGCRELHRECRLYAVDDAVVW